MYVWIKRIKIHKSSGNPKTYPRIEISEGEVGNPRFEFKSYVIRKFGC